MSGSHEPDQRRWSGDETLAARYAPVGDRLGRTCLPGPGEADGDVVAFCGGLWLTIASRRPCLFVVVPSKGVVRGRTDGFVRGWWPVNGWEQEWMRAGIGPSGPEFRVSRCP